MTRTALVAILPWVAMVSAPCLPAPAHAADIPFGQLRVDLQATHEPLNEFLARMFTLGGIPATMTPSIASARVNGRIQGAADAVFRDLAQTYGFTWFYNGAQVAVCGLGELESRLLQVGPGDVPRVEQVLSDMGLIDRRFPLKASTSEGQLLVVGPPPYVQLVSDVTARIASAPSRGALSETRLFRLRHAHAVDTVVDIAGVRTTVPGIARILQEALRGGTATPVDAPRARPASLEGLRGQGLAAGGHDPAAVPLFGPGPVSTPSSSLVPLPEAEHRLRQHGAPGPRPEAPAPPVEAEPLVRADPRLNAVIVSDRPERMARHARLIEQLDVAAALIEIEATVIDVSRDGSEQLGIDWRLRGSHFEATSNPSGVPLSPAPEVTPGLVGTLLLGAGRSTFFSRLSALAESGDARLVSKPRVLTLDNAEAVLQSTQDFHVRVAGKEQVDLFNVSVGLVLRVTPMLIDTESGSRIDLRVRIEDGAAVADTQVDQIPVVSRNAISTEAVVGSGETLLIGGYAVDRMARNDSGVPGLSTMPALRWLFGRSTRQVGSMERMFMITPRVVERPERSAWADVPAQSTKPAPWESTP